MKLHPSWQAIRDAPDLIAFPLDENGIPADLAPQIHDIQNGDTWLIVAPATARLNPEFTNVVRQHAATRRDVGVFYADEVENTGSGANQLRLKPAINLLLLIADDYIGSPVIVQLSVFRRLGGFRPEVQSAGIYDFLLRAVRDGIGIERIPVVLVAHEGRRPRPTLLDRTAAVTNWIGNSSHVFALAPGLTGTTLQLRRNFTSFPDVTLVIPTQQSRQLQVNDASYGRPHIINMLDSLVLTDWPMERIHVLIGDDNPDQAIYADCRYPFDLRLIDTQRAPDAPFNYAAKMNSLWRQADSEYLVLINDDVVVRESGWLRALMTFAMNEDVAGVGARLLYGNGALQHAGDSGRPVWLRRTWPGFFSRLWMKPTMIGLWCIGEWSMVTGAVFATRRGVLEIVDGFDERFSLEFNDVDLCLRMKLLGYKIVYTPFAELLHFRKASRGAALPKGDQVALFLKRWGELLNNDPAFNPGFDMASTHIAPVPEKNPWYDSSAMSKSTP